MGETSEQRGKSSEGFFCAGGLTLLLSIFLYFVIFFLDVMDTQDDIPLILSSAAGILGPVIGVVFWIYKPKTQRKFALGALIFGIFSFLLVGGCIFLPRL